MTDLSDALARYLIIRRALGYKLQSQEIRLRGFVAFMAHRGESVITSRLAVEWSGLQCGPATWGSRLSTVRAFANHVTLSDPRTEVPPFGVFAPQRRPRPYIYSDAQVADLMATMVGLHPTGLQARTYQCFFGLIATSGLRFSEAANLLRADINLADGTLIIRETKFGKSRVIPLHEFDRAGASALRRGSGLLPNTTGQRLLLHWRPRRQAQPLQRPQDVHRLDQTGRPEAAGRTIRPAYPRSPPHLRRSHADELVRDRRRCRAAAARADHLSGPHP